MILEVAPHTAQLVTEYAQKQGVSVDEFLLQAVGNEVQGFDFIEKDGIDSNETIGISQTAFNRLNAWLDEPAAPNPKLQRLLKEFGGLGV
ncbi:DUF1778 domain-containing protein [Moraxella oblonga]|uniref:type II toxin-antitoxin system TacA family antitoxin n=1 Tax=Moraxella oblonga TaxID=200413 RepID=UPI0008351D31|nr:DUF1778 domain-containing protein [Moraxella oblonga]